MYYQLETWELSLRYRNLQQLVSDLEKTGQLIRMEKEVDPNLEIAEIQRRAYRSKAPAILFTQVKGTPFPMVCNLFGTMERTRWIFRDTLRALKGLFALKIDPLDMVKKPWRYTGVPRALWATLPKKIHNGPILQGKTTLSQLPQLRSWPMDGGGYVTLPQVYTESPSSPGVMQSNIGMYRVQLSGEHFTPDKEIGLHYQIHRGIGHHHSEALQRGESLPVNIFVGGPPAMTLAAVMPLPEGIPELVFAGALAGFRIPMVKQNNHLPLLAEADFCISGRIYPGEVKPEGPFGDHIGYYSLAHDFPLMRVENVYHRNDAIWPFTTVGRPPQEDTVFGEFIHELTQDMVSSTFSGVHEIQAVDPAGVHPLLLAIGSERYVPYAEKRIPQELITCGLSLLGNTQTSLSKYLFIAAKEDNPQLSTYDYAAFFRHILERTDITRDLHFITKTTIDTLDYSGTGLNAGSKLLWTACGPQKRALGHQLPETFSLPENFGEAHMLMPGVAVIQGPPHQTARGTQDVMMERLAEYLGKLSGLEGFPLLVIADNAAFTAKNWENFLWVTFTRSDPATDIYGVNALTKNKHWGCKGPLLIDARLKSFHAPALEEDPATTKRVDTHAARGGALYGIIQ